ASSQFSAVVVLVVVHLAAAILEKSEYAAVVFHLAAVVLTPVRVCFFVFRFVVMANLGYVVVVLMNNMKLVVVVKKKKKNMKLGVDLRF
ncbi:hypothetical protein A2U01_0001069, partial [Trifolium medium]|nr:hypothetical protein [Trifolium medium]